IQDFSSDGVHKLSVIVMGSDFRIFVDGTFVRAFKDSTYKSGIVVIGADDTPLVLDYVRIYSLPSSTTATSATPFSLDFVGEQRLDQGSLPSAFLYWFDMPLDLLDSISKAQWGSNMVDCTCDMTGWSDTASGHLQVAVLKSEPSGIYTLRVTFPNGRLGQ